MSQIILINKEIEILKLQDPLRNWNKYFEQFSSKALAQYKKAGRYKLLALCQYTDVRLQTILGQLKKNYSFVDYDFNSLKGELIVKNVETHQFESIYIGDQVQEMILEICDKFERMELKKINEADGKAQKAEERKSKLTVRQKLALKREAKKAAKEAKLTKLPAKGLSLIFAETPCQL